MEPLWSVCSQHFAPLWLAVRLILVSHKFAVLSPHRGDQWLPVDSIRGENIVPGPQKLELHGAQTPFHTGDVLLA